ncbi:MAG: hypothetical protein JRF71_04015 [Deltaproteobacteria bacterium]|nr:hypothetical protein [Deltaproteobacteria bacterium]MBW2199987.1 hypothetical protein [Deltaproteobacteria bacterium]
MGEFFLAVLGGLFIFFFLWIVFSRRKDSGDKVVPYTCTVCGEKDCICHKEDKM